jgi:hypothetical protein
MGSHWWRYWRRRNYVRKERVEGCVTLSLSEMLQKSFLELTVGERIFRTMSFRCDYSNDRQYTLGIELYRLSPSGIRLGLVNTSQQFFLHSTPLNFGGVRWWFSCPRCRRRCAKLYLPRASAFLCRKCHNLTYESCIEGKSTTAFLADIGSRQGLSLAEVKHAIAEDGRARNKWRRKRDRRAGYRGRLQEIPEKSLKRTMLEAKAASDIVKLLGRAGML